VVRVCFCFLFVGDGGGCCAKLQGFGRGQDVVELVKAFLGLGGLASDFFVEAFELLKPEVSTLRPPESTIFQPSRPLNSSRVPPILQSQSLLPPHANPQPALTRTQNSARTSTGNSASHTKATSPTQASTPPAPPPASYGPPNKPTSTVSSNGRMSGPIWARARPKWMTV